MKKAIGIGLSILALGSAVPVMAEPYGYFDRLGDRIDARLDARERSAIERIDLTCVATGSTTG